TGALIAFGQLSLLIRDFKIGGAPVTILFWTLPALQFAVRLDRVLDGLSRPFFGWISDQIGRENTMFIAFLGEGIAIYALFSFAMDPLLFVMLSGVIFFAWGEIYSLFPGDVHRSLRSQVHDDELRDVVHREGRGIPARPIRRSALLHEGCLHRRGPAQHCRRPHGGHRLEGAAGTPSYSGAAG